MNIHYFLRNGITLVFCWRMSVNSRVSKKELKTDEIPFWLNLDPLQKTPIAHDKLCFRSKDA